MNLNNLLVLGFFNHRLYELRNFSVLMRYCCVYFSLFSFVFFFSSLLSPHPLKKGDIIYIFLPLCSFLTQGFFNILILLNLLCFLF